MGVAEERPAGPCFSPIDPGTCDGVEKRFAFNVNTRRCQMFHYSGCGGNHNNFLRRRECMVKCGGRQKGRKDKRERRSVTSPLHSLKAATQMISTKYDCDLQLMRREI